MSDKIITLEKLSATLASHNLCATGGADNLVFAVSCIDHSKRWTQRYGMPGMWAQMLAYYPLKSKLVAVTLTELGITVDSETHMSDVMFAAQARGLFECPFGTIPLLLSADIHLASTGSTIGDAYRRVVACTPTIGTSQMLFAFRNESGSRLCACHCYGYPNVRIIEMFSDDGLCFAGTLPSNNPQRDIAFLFATNDTEPQVDESVDYATIALAEDTRARTLIEDASRLTTVPAWMKQQDELAKVSA